MRRITTICIALLMCSGSMEAATAQTPTSFVCETTSPGEKRPTAAADPFADGESVYFEDGIWVSVPEDGVLTLTPNDEIEALPLVGWRSTTFTWMRAEGVEGFVVVSGERLDDGSDLSPQTPLSPQRQYTKVGYVQTGIAFPSTGCWEVTGTVGDHSITWVMEVRFVEEAVATPKPCPNCRLQG